MNRKANLSLIAALLLVPFSVMLAQDDKKAAVEPNLVAAKANNPNAPAPDQPQKPATTDPNYTIGPDDELSVSVWKEPEISRTVSVRPDGKISLPLVNDIHASGLTPMRLGIDIAEKLKKYIAEPQVTVIITKINSQRVFIVGEVPRAGAYSLLPNMTVLQGLTSAGGFTQFANLKKIHILRMENGKQISIPFNYKEVVSGRRPEQNIQLKPGDTIVVP